MKKLLALLAVGLLVGACTQQRADLTGPEFSCARDGAVGWGDNTQPYDNGNGECIEADLAPVFDAAALEPCARTGAVGWGDNPQPYENGNGMCIDDDGEVVAFLDYLADIDCKDGDGDGVCGSGQEQGEPGQHEGWRD